MHESNSSLSDVLNFLEICSCLFGSTFERFYVTSEAEDAYLPLFLSPFLHPDIDKQGSHLQLIKLFIQWYVSKHAMNSIYTQQIVFVNFKVLTMTFECLIDLKFILCLRLEIHYLFWTLNFLKHLFKCLFSPLICHISDLQYLGWFSDLSVLFHFCLK